MYKALDSGYTSHLILQPLTPKPHISHISHLRSHTIRFPYHSPNPHPPAHLSTSPHRTGLSHCIHHNLISFLTTTTTNPTQPTSTATSPSTQSNPIQPTKQRHLDLPSLSFPLSPFPRLVKKRLICLLTLYLPSPILHPIIFLSSYFQPFQKSCLVFLYALRSFVGNGLKRGMGWDRMG